MADSRHHISCNIHTGKELTDIVECPFIKGTDLHCKKDRLE